MGPSVVRPQRDRLIEAHQRLPWTAKFEQGGSEAVVGLRGLRPQRDRLTMALERFIETPKLVQRDPAISMSVDVIWL